MIYHKLEVKLSDLIKSVRDSLHNLEVVVSKKLTESKLTKRTRKARKFEKQTVASLEEQVFKVKEENKNLEIQLDHAKRSLLSEIQLR